ncbi:MAG: hypothetical protein M3Q11_06980, partial [Pseudomonadota bacterium]|nr:hypothetical protein [Pseudomonadota bacterium]
MGTTASRVARGTLHSFAAIAGSGLLLSLLSACQPEPPERERPPEPQAGLRDATRPATLHDQPRSGGPEPSVHG